MIAWVQTHARTELSEDNIYVCSRTHVNSRIQTHTRHYTYAITHMQTHEYKRTQGSIHTNTNARKEVYLCNRTHANSRIQTHPRHYTYAIAHMQTHEYKRTQGSTHTNTNAHKEVYLCNRTHANSRIQTHTFNHKYANARKILYLRKYTHAIASTNSYTMNTIVWSHFKNRQFILMLLTHHINSIVAPTSVSLHTLTYLFVKGSELYTYDTR